MISIKKIIALLYCLIASLLVSSCDEPFGKGMTFVFEHRDCQTVTLFPLLRESNNDLILRVRTNGELLEPDLVIESKVLSYHHRKTSDSGATMHFVTYHTVTCTDLRIEASEPLFGVDAGEDISSFFVLDKDGPGYIFNSQKELIGSISKYSYEHGEMTVAEWLNLRPMMIHELYLKSRMVTDMPSDIVFSIKLSIDGDKMYATASNPLVD